MNVNIKKVCEQILAKIDENDLTRYRELKFLNDIKSKVKLTEKQGKWLRDLAKKENVSCIGNIDYKQNKQPTRKRFMNNDCEHDDLGSLGYKHGTIVNCPFCGKRTEVW